MVAMKCPLGRPAALTHRIISDTQQPPGNLAALVECPQELAIQPWLVRRAEEHQGQTELVPSRPIL